MSEANGPESAGAAPPGSAGRSWAPLWALLLMAAGIATYLALIDYRWSRIYGMPSVLLMLAGAIVATQSLLRRRTVPRILVSVICVALLALKLGALTGLLGQVPPAQAVARDATSFPAFSRVNHRGEAVTLDGYLAKGPLLVIFYRGHW